MSEFVDDGIEATDREGCGLRVLFLRRADRVAHAVEQLVDGRVVATLRSREGTPADAWPPSPPLQSWSVEDRPEGRRVALLVGMAGQSHWSASIETIPSERAVVFDIACRTSGPPGRLSSCYALDDATLADFEARRATFQSGLALQIVSAATTLHRDEGHLSINCTTATAAHSPKTWRWQYRLQHGKP